MGNRRDVRAALDREAHISIALGDLAAGGLPPLVWTDAGNGIRDAAGATAFPSSLALAASFDTDLARRHGEALGREAKAAGRNAVLGPALDIARVPVAGRTGESFGEDPLLTGELGGSVAAGIQSQAVLAVVKHYLANNFEHGRTGSGSFARRTHAVDVRIGAGTLRELYAEPFRRALVDYGAGGLMGSYNRLGGRYVCENPALLRIPRAEWGWQGVIVPDFLFAVRDHEAALAAGLDLPGLDAPSGRTRTMVEGAGEETLEAIASHVLTALDLSGVEAPANPRLPLDDAASQALAQEELEAGAVLLRNDELLPLDAGAVGTVALVGVDDPTALLVMGGSAAVGLSSARIASVADQLETRTGARPVVAPGTRGDVPLPPLRSVVSAVVRDDGAGTEQTVALDEFALLDPPAEVGADWSAVLETAYEPTDSGPHVLTLTFAGEARLLVGGEELATGFREASPMVEGPEYPLHAVAHLTEGRSVRVRVEYRTGPAITIPGTPVRPGLRLGVEPVAERISAAVDAAAAADVAVLIVGRVTGEAMDADSIRLPGDQELLVRAVTAANPRTVLVTLSGGPVALPDGVQPAAVLHVWNPGEGFAPALVRLLFGDAEPGGRLPLTFPGDEAQTPVAASGRYPGADGVVDYDEGLLVGYRWYDAEEIEPAYPFGHGLGYTEIALDRFTAERIGDRITARLTVRNSGARTGKAVPQIYSSSPAPAGHPPQTLRAFAAVRLEPGESRRLSLDIPVRDLVAYDTEGTPSVHAGTYTFTAGWSSRDLVAASDVVVESS